VKGVAAKFFVLGALLGLTSVGLAADAAPLRAGEFAWNPELSANGPLVVIISLNEQTLSAYRNGIRIAQSSISSGTSNRRTPTGVFTILEKEVTHFSNKYHHAPMPYMQRLTWQGVALHGGILPGYPASHGCIRLPAEFAKLLYSVTTRGTTVIVVDDKAPKPKLAARPGMIWWPEEAGAARPLERDFEWTPERSPEGPITILASTADKTLYVYRNGELIGRAILAIDESKRLLGSHVFTMLEGESGRPSTFVRGRPAHRWMAVKTEGSATLSDLAKRVRVSEDFAEKVYEILTPGTTIVVTDDPALPAARAPHEVPLMEGEQKQ
jgi:hypothetical protein